jgi:hypothetical protein
MTKDEVKRRNGAKKRVSAATLWLEFLGPDIPIPALSMAEAPLKNAYCGLCGGYGVIDTRDRVFTPAGTSCGVRRFCICPNGRVMKRYSKRLVPA